MRGEYKAVRVVFETDGNESGVTLYEKVMLSSEPMSERIGTLQDIKNGEIIANCQNIKLDEFDYLDYVLVDDDGFHIFEITSKNFTKYAESNEFPNWSPNHGRKEHGANGQFPIKFDNLDWHIQHNLKKELTWKEIYLLAKQILL